MRYAFMIIASDNHAYRRLTPFAPVIRGHKCLFGVFPPLPHPNWARSVAPASLAGRLKPLFRPVWRGLPPAPIPCALPPRGRAPCRLAQTINALPIIAPCKSPFYSGFPRQEQWRTKPPMPLPARPPPLKGWISTRHKQQMPRRL